MSDLRLRYHVAIKSTGSNVDHTSFNEWALSRYRGRDPETSRINQWSQPEVDMAEVSVDDYHPEDDGAIEFETEVTPDFVGVSASHCTKAELATGDGCLWVPVLGQEVVFLRDGTLLYSENDGVEILTKKHAWALGAEALREAAND